MNVFLGDLKYSIRTLFRTPGFTIVAVVALTLGIGAMTTIFSIVNAVLLKPVAVSDPDRFVMLLTTEVSQTGEIIRTDSDASPLKFELWRGLENVIQVVSAFSPGVMNYSGSGAVEEWRSIQASADFFRCWGIPILRGRTFTPQEDLPGGPRVVVISQGIWEWRFVGDPEILGKTISLNGEPSVVIGILTEMPGLHKFGFVSAASNRSQYRRWRELPDGGRTRKAGVTLAQAKERLQAFAYENRAKYPNTIGERGGFTVRPLREVVSETFVRCC